MATTRTNFFESAQPAAKPGNVKKTTALVAVEGLEMRASIGVVEEVLTTLKALYDGTVKVHMHEYFCAKGCQLKKRPENFKGTEGDAEGSLQIKKRTSNSKLSTLEVALCEKHNIPLLTVPNTFSINPKYCDLSDPANVKRMKKINDALAKIKDLETDLFVVEEGKTLVTDESMDAVFNLKVEDVAILRPVVSTLAIRDKLRSNDPETIQRAFDRVAKAIGTDLNAPEDKKAKKRVETLPEFARPKKKKYAGVDASDED